MTSSCNNYPTSLMCRCKRSWTFCQDGLGRNCTEWYGCTYAGGNYQWCMVEHGSCPPSAQQQITGLFPSWDYCSMGDSIPPQPHADVGLMPKKKTLIMLSKVLGALMCLCLALLALRILLRCTSRLPCTQMVITHVKRLHEWLMLQWRSCGPRCTQMISSVRGCLEWFMLCYKDFPGACRRGLTLMVSRSKEAQDRFVLRCKAFHTSCGAGFTQMVNSVTAAQDSFVLQCRAFHASCGAALTQMVSSVKEAQKQSVLRCRAFHASCGAGVTQMMNNAKELQEWCGQQCSALYVSCGAGLQLAASSIQGLQECLGRWCGAFHVSCAAGAEKVANNVKGLQEGFLQGCRSFHDKCKGLHARFEGFSFQRRSTLSEPLLESPPESNSTRDTADGSAGSWKRCDCGEFQYCELCYWHKC